MAIRDVKDYYFKMVAQYLEMKADLADFEQALKDGFITEDQMQAALEEVDKVQQNYERLSYIMYLLEMPNRPAKKAKYKKSNKPIEDHFADLSANARAIECENASALKHLREELKKLSK
jgi:hypothetical protein